MSRPLDTVGGIVDKIRETNGSEKCGATKMVGNGISFCTQPKGHDGKHGNGRKTWGKAKRTSELPSEVKT